MKAVLFIAVLSVIFADVLSWHTIEKGGHLYVGDVGEGYSYICYNKIVTTYRRTKHIECRPRPDHEVSALSIHNLNKNSKIEVQTSCGNTYKVDIRSSAFKSKFAITIFCNRKAHVRNHDGCHQLALGTEENEEVGEEIIEDLSYGNDANEWNYRTNGNKSREVLDDVEEENWRGSRGFYGGRVRSHFPRTTQAPPTGNYVEDGREELEHPVNGNNPREVLEDVKEENWEESRGGYHRGYGRTRFPIRTTQQQPTGNYAEDGGEKLLEHPVKDNKPREVLENVKEENWDGSRGVYHGGHGQSYFPKTTQSPSTGNNVEDGDEELLEWRADLEALQRSETRNYMGNEDEML